MNIVFKTLNMLNNKEIKKITNKFHENFQKNAQGNEKCCTFAPLN